MVLITKYKILNERFCQKQCLNQTVSDCYASPSTQSLCYFYFYFYFDWPFLFQFYQFFFYWSVLLLFIFLFSLTISNRLYLFTFYWSVLLPRLRRLLPADRSSRETGRGACCCSWTSWAQGLCPVSPGKGREGCWSQDSPGKDGEGCWTESSSSMALPSSLPRRPQPPLSSWRWPRTTLDGKCG